MIDAPLLTLRAGTLELVIDPAAGGCIRSFTDDGFAILRTSTGDQRDPASYSSFMLVPYSGRIDRGRFAFGGIEHQLPLNFAPEPHAIHGDGWTASWTVADQSASRATILFHHEARRMAFRYRAWQALALTEDGLRIEFGVRNTGDAAMPFGLGHHPYFDRLPGATLQADVAEIWLPDPLNIPKDSTSIPDWADFRTERPVAEMTLDHIFTQFADPATIRWPNEGRGVRIEGDDVLDRLVVFIPPNQDYFCVEPVSHVANAINMPDIEAFGLRILQPNDELRATMALNPFKLR